MTLKRKEIVDELIRRIGNSFPNIYVTRDVVGMMMDSVVRSSPLVVVTEDVEKCEKPSVGLYEKNLTVVVNYFATSVDISTDLYEVIEGLYDAIELDMRFKQNGNGDDLVISYGMIENNVAYYDDPMYMYSIELIYTFKYKETISGYSTNPRKYTRRPG